MAKYRVLEKSFINNAIVEEGKVIDYDGIPGPNLEPLDAPAQAAAADGAIANTESLARQKVAALGGDPDAVDTTVATSVAAQAAQAALTGHTVSVDGKPIDAPVRTTPGAGDLV